MPPDDLLERCLAGDQAAWSALVDRYAGLVYAIARAHRLDEPACDDVAQAVFAALVRRLPELREPRALPGWISTSAQRECWRVRARTRREPVGTPADDGSPVQPAPDRLEAIEQAQRVREALDELGGRCRDLLVALYMTGTAEPDYPALSRQLGMPVGSIGPTRARCLAKLARILGPDG